jgi:hypothetical protein
VEKKFQAKLNIAFTAAIQSKKSKVKLAALKRILEINLAPHPKPK